MRDLATGVSAEKADLGRHATGHGRLGDVGRGSMPERADATGNGVLEEVPVVARHLHDERILAESQPLCTP